MRGNLPSSSQLIRARLRRQSNNSNFLNFKIDSLSQGFSLSIKVLVRDDKSLDIHCVILPVFNLLQDDETKEIKFLKCLGAMTVFSTLIKYESQN